MSPGRRDVLLAAGGLLAGSLAVDGAGAREVANPSETTAARPNAARENSDTTADTGETARQVRTVDAEFRLSADEHRSFEFSFDGSTALTVDLVVRWGPGVDVLLFEPEEYRAYLNGYRARYFQNGSVFDTVNVEGSVVTLTAGDYVLVVDNTGWDDELPQVSGESDGGDGEGGRDRGNRAVGVDAELTATR